MPQSPIALSTFGTKLTARTGILELMDDLGAAMSGAGETIMLGGGNPPHIPEVKALFKQQMHSILNDPNRFNHMIGSYDSPQGHAPFINALTHYLNTKYSWNLTPKNILLTNGSQTAFFYLFNILAGPHPDGTHKHILLPLAPEYIGYLDQGIHPDLFRSYQPTFEYLDDHTFKYHVDFNHLQVTSDTAAICVSRPTNPTGNVLTNAEIDQLSALAKHHHIPLIIDNAYGAPFPNIIFNDIQPIWDQHIILTLSLSKIGLPATRTGIVIAHENIITALSGVNAIVSLAPNSIGPELMTDLISSRHIDHLSNHIINPFYKTRAQAAIQAFHQACNPDIPYYLHTCEGSLFLWLWCKDMPITSYELYTRLKTKGVLVVPGEYFFPGIDPSWQHTKECLRINYSHAPEKVHAGLKIIAQELQTVYNS